MGISNLKSVLSHSCYVVSYLFEAIGDLLHDHDDSGLENLIVMKDDNND